LVYFYFLFALKAVFYEKFKTKRKSITRKLGCPEICGGKPQNMHATINKICENMRFIILAEIMNFRQNY